MNETNRKMCRICLKNDLETSITDGTIYYDFFKRIVGLNQLPSVIWLCLWCRSAINKAEKLLKVALESQKILDIYSKDKTALCMNTMELYTLSYSRNQVDISPSNMENNDNSLHKSFTDLKTNSDHTHINVQFKNSTEKENKEEFNKNQFEKMHVSDKGKAKSKKYKNEPNYEEMKFCVQQLSYDEQRQEIEKKKEKNKSMRYLCCHCGVGFLTEDVFREHMQKHNESAGLHQCGVCRLRFKSSSVLSQHTLAHRRRFVCSLCDAVFNRWTHCVAHRSRCGDTVLPVVCAQCRKIFSDKHSLGVHIRSVHGAAKKYECAECGRRFSSKQRLVVHHRSHSGERPFPCPRCPRRFATNSNLRSHQSVHESARPYYCVECDTRYKSGKALRRHLTESARHLTG